MQTFTWHFASTPLCIECSTILIYNWWVYYWIKLTVRWLRCLWFHYYHTLLETALRMLIIILLSGLFSWQRKLDIYLVFCLLSFFFNVVISGWNLVTVAPIVKGLLMVDCFTFCQNCFLTKELIYWLIYIVWI